MWTPIGAFVEQTGAVGILALGVVGLFLGWLIPRWVVTQMRTDLGSWRKTAETALEANKELAEHVGRLVATTEQLMEAQRDTQALVRTLVADAAKR